MITLKSMVVYGATVLLTAILFVIVGALGGGALGPGSIAHAAVIRPASTTGGPCIC